jgi:hypothetical protein
MLNIAEDYQARPRPAIPAPMLLTVRQFSEKHPAFTQGAIRQLIFASRPRKTSRGKLPGNGLAIALIRLGRKILIDEAQFFAWLDSKQRRPAA